MTAFASAGLLVGEHRHDQVAGRFATGARQLPDVGDDHRVHVLHVDRSAAPDAAVLDLGAERIDLPVAGGGRNDIEVTVHHQRIARTVRAGDPNDDTGPARVALDDHGVETDLLELPHDVLRRFAFTGAAAVTEVAGVEGDQVLADLDDLIKGSGLISHAS